MYIVRQCLAAQCTTGVAEDAHVCYNAEQFFSLDHHWFYTSLAGCSAPALYLKFTCEEVARNQLVAAPAGWNMVQHMKFIGPCRSQGQGGHKSGRPIDVLVACMSRGGREPGYKKTNQDNCFAFEKYISEEQSLFGTMDGHGPHGEPLGSSSKGFALLTSFLAVCRDQTCMVVSKRMEKTLPCVYVGCI